MKKPTILILSLPRSGSSLLTNLITSCGYNFSITKGRGSSFTAHEFNKGGYFEDVIFTLLNDQLIRLYFGLSRNFLNPPYFENFLETANRDRDKLPSDFEYDVDKTNVIIPDNFNRNIQNLTGAKWDVWGITRMVNGGKWEKCYSKNGVDTKDKILKKLIFYKKQIENPKKLLVLKDPRLAISMPFYHFSNIKIIWIKRKKEGVLKSMRRHYGPRLFTDKLINGTNFVSNHFNFKVPPIDFSDYVDRYENIIKYSVKRYPSLTIDFERLVHLEDIDQLENFIEGKVDLSIISPSLTSKNS